MTSNPQIIPFSADHLSLTDHADIKIGPKFRRMAGGVLEASGPAFSAFADGIFLGSGGVIPLWQGVGEAWAVIPPESAKYGLFLTRTARDMIQEVMTHLHLHRLQAIVLTPQGGRWVHLLGFAYEGSLEKYGPQGEDFTIWKILK